MARVQHSWVTEMVGNGNIDTCPLENKLLPQGPVQAFQTVASRLAQFSLGSIVAKIILLQNNWEKQELGNSLHVGLIFEECNNNKYK